MNHRPDLVRPTTSADFGTGRAADLSAGMAAEFGATRTIGDVGGMATLIAIVRDLADLRTQWPVREPCGPLKAASVRTRF